MSGGTRPACSSRGKAFNDPKVQSMNGGYLKAAIDCQQACSAAPLCVYWTYYNDTGACWLQGAQVTEFLNAEAISGPKLCEDAAKASRYAAGHNITNGDQMVMMRSFHRPNCSFRGKALRDPALHVPNSYQESPEECQSLCIKTMSRPECLSSLLQTCIHAYILRQSYIDTYIHTMIYMHTSANV